MKRILSVSMLVCTIAVSGCDQDGNTVLGGQKQSIGTLVGGLTGGLLGSRFGHGTGAVAATGAGALLGAALGNYIGAELDAKDKEDAQRAIEQALNRPGTATVPWRNSASGNGGTIVAQPVRYETRSVAAAAPATVAAPPANPEPAAPLWSAPHGANLRAAPAPDAPVVGHLRAARSFAVAGEVPNSDWLIVTAHGRTVGYVSSTVARPVGNSAIETARAAEPGPMPEGRSAPAEPSAEPAPTQAAQVADTVPLPAPQQPPQPQAMSGETQPPAQTAAAQQTRAEAVSAQAALSPPPAAADPDAIELGGTGHTDRVACRTIVSTVQLKDQGATQPTQTEFCRQPDGSWVPAKA